MAGPNAYEPDDKPKEQKIIDIDCRGLEFIEFKPDVSFYIHQTLFFFFFFFLSTNIKVFFYSVLF